MRRKIVILLAVPLLFLVSLVFLMADIKNLSTQNDELLNIATDTVQRVAGKPFSKPEEGPGSLDLHESIKKQRDVLIPEETNTSPSERTNTRPKPERAPPKRPDPEETLNRPPLPQPAENEERPDQKPHESFKGDSHKEEPHKKETNKEEARREEPLKQEPLKQEPPAKPQPDRPKPPPLTPRPLADQPKTPNTPKARPDKTPKPPPTKKPKVTPDNKPKVEPTPVKHDITRKVETDEEAENQKLEDLPLQPAQAKTIGGFNQNNAVPAGQQSINDHKKVPHDETPSSTVAALSASELKKRAVAVKSAYLHAWNSYERYAWSHDELKPLSKTPQDWLYMGLSIVDSIDTMYLMGLTAEYEKARSWIATHLHFNVLKEVSFFETTIRVIGGLVSIYDLTGDSMYIEKAEQLANKLMPAFNTPSGIPYTTIDLRSGAATNPQWAAGASILSEAGTVQMEYATLSRHTGNQEFGRKALRVFDQLDSMNKPNGLYPVYINPNSGTFSRNHVTLGALGDSFYEYLLKMYLLTGKQNPQYLRMYGAAMDAVVINLLKYSTPSNLAYIAEWDGGQVIHKMDHLVCFAGAMFALGAYHNATEKVDEHMKIGKEITRTCHEMYKRQASGLAPELVRFKQDADFHPGANHYILRPETVESYYVLYWITQDPIYQQWGWEAFQAIEKHCRTPNGYCGVRDVTTTTVVNDDLQQSFFMAETLKYLYLLFAPRETLSLDEYVFNTEAHPIKIWK